jgi:LacI family transcriptional regulator
MATIKEVAREAGVSVGTVSNVLVGVKPVSPELLERVNRAIKKLKYRPDQIARSLKTKQTRTLAMVISDITNPFFPELVRGAEDAAREQGYMLATFNTDDQVEREQQVMRIIESRRVDGALLVVALPKGDLAHVQALVEMGVPVVCLDRKPPELAVDSVTVDNAGGVRAAVEHMIRRGARRIAYLGGDSRFYLAAERLAGYREALAAAGLAFDPSLVLEGDFRRESGLRQGRLLLEQQPDGLFAANILMTYGVIDAMAERGWTPPSPLRLATFDRPKLLPAFGPKLTAVEQPTYQIGYQGAQLLLERISGKRTAVTGMVLPTTLVVGETT